MDKVKPYRFCSLASRVRRGVEFLDNTLPFGIWYLDISESDLLRLDMNSCFNDLLAIIFDTSFSDATFQLGISGGESIIFGFNPYHNNPIESYKLDRLWRYVIKKRQKQYFLGLQ